MRLDPVPPPDNNNRCVRTHAWRFRYRKQGRNNYRRSIANAHRSVYEIIRLRVIEMYSPHYIHNWNHNNNNKNMFDLVNKYRTVWPGKTGYNLRRMLSLCNHCNAGTTQGISHSTNVPFFPVTFSPIFTFFQTYFFFTKRWHTNASIVKLFFFLVKINVHNLF